MNTDLPQAAAELAQKLSVFLAPLLPKLLDQTIIGAGREAGKKTLDQSLAWGQRLWEKLRPKIDAAPAALEAAQDVAAHPQDADFEASLRAQLKKLLAADVELANEMTRLCQAAGASGVRVFAPGARTVIAAKKVRGGVAKGRSAAAGKGSVAGRDFTKTIVVTGKKNIVKQTNIAGDAYFGTPPGSARQALTAYCEMLVTNASRLPLRGMDLGASDPQTGQQQVELDQVYVSLNTTSSVKVRTPRKAPVVENPLLTDDRKRRPLSALEAAAANRRAVILGDPGSGKSTFLNHLTLCLALHALQPKGRWADRLAGWPLKETDLLPIPVVLRDFAAELGTQAGPKPGKAAPCLLWSFVRGWLDQNKLEGAAATLEEALNAGRALVLLDGLDEVPTAALRARVKDAVAAFTGRFKRSRAIVTCRVLSYQDKEWQLPEWRAFTLAPFSEPMIDQFIGAWYADLHRLKMLKRAEAETLAGRLRAAIRRPDLWRLAPNPLLLTVMALVHTHKGRLPDARALLYEDTVDLLLWRWEQIKLAAASDTPHLRALLAQADRSDVDLKRALWQLAFEAHGAAGPRDDEALADVGELALQNTFKGLHPEASLDWSKRMIEALKLRAGLLLERKPQLYTFPHRTFQEYLAGAHLASQPDFERRAARLFQQGAFWREVILLAVGRLVYLSGETGRPLALVAELCPEHAVATEAAWRNAWLAGDVLLEIGAKRAAESSNGSDLLRRAALRLVALMEAGALSPVERAKAGVALGKLGDPRNGVGLRADGVPDVDWVTVEPGPFPMGNDKPQARYDHETPRFTCRLIGQGYRLSRYPVTVAQYQAFVEAGGYHEAKYWTRAGWQWRQSEKVERPEDYDEVYQTPNHPRVGVSWYEAVPFCRWLSERLGFAVSLPSEAQWERAARHTDGRTYPWGEAEDVSARANVRKTGIGSTSAVGMFPQGKAQCGALDLSGNVCEWCRIQWTGDYKDYERKVDDDLEGQESRVLRGGAWNDPNVGARCSDRDGDEPDDRFGLIGFRVVAPPFDSGG